MSDWEWRGPMTDLDCIEYAVQVVLAKCRERNPMSIPPSGETVMQWFAAALNEAKAIRSAPIQQPEGEDHALDKS